MRTAAVAIAALACACQRGVPQKQESNAVIAGQERPATAARAAPVETAPAAPTPVAPAPTPAPAANAPAPAANTAPTAVPDVTAAAASANAAPANTAAANAPAQPAHVTLPKSADTPPKKTKRPLAKPELDRLSKIEFPDFERSVRAQTAAAIEFEYATKTRPLLGVTIRIQPCERGKGKRPCPPMQLAAWTAPAIAAQIRKTSLPPKLAGRPDTKFDIGQRNVAGVPAIFTYQLGAAFGVDEHKQPEGVYTDVYRLYYNDGINQIRVEAAYQDDSVGGIDRLAAIAPQEDLEKLAAAFLGYFIHEWH